MVPGALLSTWQIDINCITGNLPADSKHSGKCDFIYLVSIKYIHF